MCSPMGLMNYVRAIDISIELVLIALIAEVLLMTLNPHDLRVSTLLILNSLTLLMGLVTLRYTTTEIDVWVPTSLAIVTTVLYAVIVAYSLLNKLSQAPNAVGATGVIISVMALIKLRGDLWV